MVTKVTYVVMYMPTSFMVCPTSNLLSVSFIVQGMCMEPRISSEARQQGMSTVYQLADVVVSHVFLRLPDVFSKGPRTKLFRPCCRARSHLQILAHFTPIRAVPQGKVAVSCLVCARILLMGHQRSGLPIPFVPPL